MTQRWWAPEGAHIGPDERDFELLIPLDDSRHDLGAALLALHRVGAAACEEVALHAIPDEVSLVQALASARAAFAAPLVESVSKSVGEGPYAGLLVRDTIDDAESAALLVFRTLVSTGVPGQVAAQRAGMVYGVPEDGLTPFLTVAKELRAHPAALIDAADRALFSAIEKIASEEAVEKVQPFEEVSKTTPENVRTRRDPGAAAPDPVRTPRPATLGEDDPTTDYYDGRDAEGRFARGSVAGPPEVGKAPERTKRTTRTARTQRVQRPSRAAATPTAARSRARSKQRAASRDVARLSRTREARTKEQIEEVLADLPQVEWSAGDYMQPMGSSSHERFEQLDHEVAIAMSTKEWGELQSHLGRDEDGLLAFRMGHLSQEGGVERFGAASDYERDAHRGKLKHIAQEELAALQDQFPGADLQRPVAVTVDDDDLVQMGPLEIREHVMGVKFDALVEHFTEMGVDPYTPEMQKVIEQIMERQMPSNRSPDGTGDVYTYVPRMSGTTIVANVKVVELVFDAGVQGVDEGHGQHTEYRFNPNQVMRIENARPEVIYDPRISAFRLRYHVNPGFSKADDPRTPYYDHREGGKFATLSTRRGTLVARDPQAVAQEPVAAPAPVERVSRTTRSARVSRPSRERTFQPKSKARSKTRSSARSTQRARARQVQEAAATLVNDRRRHAGYRELSAKGSYKIMAREEFADLIDKHFTDQEEPGDPVQIYGTDRLALLVGAQGGREADFTMKEMTDQDILREQYGTPYVALSLPNGKQLRLSGEEEPSEVAAKIMDYVDSLFYEHEDVDQVLVDYFHDGAVTFYGNMNPAEPVVMIEHDVDLDPDAPIELVWDGELTTDDFVPDFDDPIVDLKAIERDAAEQYDDDMHDALLPLKVTRPKVELWRLRNVKPATDESR